MCVKCDQEKASAFIVEETHVKDGSDVRIVTLKNEVWRRIAQEGRCWYCGCQLTGKKDSRGSLLTTRPVKRRLRSRIGGKRGRNSGKVSQHGK